MSLRKRGSIPPGIVGPRSKARREERPLAPVKDLIWDRRDSRLFPGGGPGFPSIVGVGRVLDRVFSPESDEPEEEEVEVIIPSCETLAKLYRENCKSKTKASKNGVIHDAQVCGLLKQIGAIEALVRGDYPEVDRLVFAYLRRE